MFEVNSIPNHRKRKKYFPQRQSSVNFPHSPISGRKWSLTCLKQHEFFATKMWYQDQHPSALNVLMASGQPHTAVDTKVYDKRDHANQIYARN